MGRIKTFTALICIAAAVALTASVNAGKEIKTAPAGKGFAVPYRFSFRDVFDLGLSPDALPMIGEDYPDFDEADAQAFKARKRFAIFAETGSDADPAAKCQPTVPADLGSNNL